MVSCRRFHLSRCPTKPLLSVAISFAWLIQVAEAIHPNASKTADAHAVLSAVIFVVNKQPPPSNWSKERFAAAMVATAWRESGFRMSAIGDGGRSRCAFQVTNGSSDPIRCASAAAFVIRESVRICPPQHPLAGYIGGCRIPAAQAESAIRMCLADGALTKVGQNGFSVKPSSLAEESEALGAERSAAISMSLTTRVGTVCPSLFW